MIDLSIPPHIPEYGITGILASSTATWQNEPDRQAAPQSRSPGRIPWEEVHMPAEFRRSQNAGWYRFNLGGWEGTVVWDGYIHHGYEGIFPNAAPEEMARLQAEHRLPSDHIPMDLNPVVMNTGDRLILIDAGMGQASMMFGDRMGRFLENLAAAGHAPEEIDMVLMTHLHPDHSYGLIHPDGSAVFPNATLVVTQVDRDEWTDPANLIRNDFRKIWTEGTLQAVAPYRDRMQIAVPGTEVVPGVTAMSVAGHSAGMCGYIFENGGEKVIFTGDLAHHQVYDPIHPEWFFHMDYDTDPLQGAAAKAEVFAEVTRHGIRYHGYHFPWPGLGVMAAQGDGTYLFHADLPTPRL